jgi:hypothetical protein
MRIRAIILSGVIAALASTCVAKGEVTFGPLPISSPVRVAQSRSVGASTAYSLTSTWLGLFDFKETGEANTTDDKAADKTPKTPAGKVWMFLNSSFGLWVLSSVVLAWITKAYSTRQAAKIESLKRAESAKRLDTEIAYRVAMALDGNRINEARLDTSPTTPQGIYQVAYNYLENFFIQGTENNRDFSVFPEFKERTFRALILELMTLVEAQEVPDLKEALEAYEELSEGGDIGSLDSSPQACKEAFARTRELLQGRIVRPRWKKMVSFLAVPKRSGFTQQAGQVRA